MINLYFDLILAPAWFHVPTSFMLDIDEKRSNLSRSVHIIYIYVVFLIFRSFFREEKKITSFERKEGHEDEFWEGKEVQWSSKGQKSKTEGPRRVHGWSSAMAQLCRNLAVKTQFSKAAHRRSCCSAWHLYVDQVFTLFNRISDFVEGIFSTTSGIFPSSGFRFLLAAKTLLGRE